MIVETLALHQEWDCTNFFFLVRHSAGNISGRDLRERYCKLGLRDDVSNWRTTGPCWSYSSQHNEDVFLMLTSFHTPRLASLSHTVAAPQKSEFQFWQISPPSHCSSNTGQKYHKVTRQFSSSTGSDTLAVPGLGLIVVAFSSYLKLPSSGLFSPHLLL